ncbi:serine/threonine-protein kinase HipA [Gillisia sp. Hel1_33_143]|uniref:HipA N-terminal domain-containing protein n=1 Tax=Gillisia sp. Hel1_33_143 TaxID=1336796 RepID=UPI00087CC09C|nr:HipA N-terminal domain-containing protein [Gillisia sp. Hel1_33_143]SDR77559.1 serine/threonine-protein kinase HipA [Gillisia sp. Hel1_33_143]
MRKAKIFIDDLLAGILSENEEGYFFQYEKTYLDSMVKKPVSLTLPLQKEPFKAEYLFPFFDGLIPEGWLLNIAQKNWKLNPRDRMGLLMDTCKDCIGNISVTPL